MLGFTPYWDYKPTTAIHADSQGLYTSEKILNLCTVDKIQLKCDSVHGGILDGVRKTVLYNFVLDKTAGYQIFREPETIQYEKSK